MKIRFLKLKNWLLLTAMGMLGLTSCNSSKHVAQKADKEGGGTSVEPREEIMLMYGTPTRDYLEQEADTTAKQPSPRDEIALMYGVPTMDFVVKGRVIDADGKPVKGMQVVLVNQTVDISPENMYEDNPYVRDYIKNASDTTDAEGNFNCHVTDVPVEQQRIIVRDVDGEKNGRYEDQMIDVVFTSADQSGERKGWYQGTSTKDVDITVVKKKK